ncbi:MAG: RagB/SusD family nutrient uptake outer membrane protein [Gemmatimonadales bacterium]|nr:MAG: RagB/SusD family nutrient uptake outer membrane protein [Gemmatimonadales bacterium]
MRSEDMINSSDLRHPAMRTLSTLGKPALLFLSVFALGGCDGILSVEAPGLVDAGDLDNPQNASFLVSGTISDFDCALGAYIVNQGLLGNELQDASVTAGRFSLDQRTITDSSPYGLGACSANPPGIYRPLSTARWSADNALARLDGWSDNEVANRTRLIGQAAAYSGYSHLLLGEGFCTVVIEEEGPEVQPAQAFEAAVARFGRAIESARIAGDAPTETMALLGRARTHLNLGNGTQAAADARAALGVNPQFQTVATASSASARRWNRVGDEFFGGRITVPPPFRDLTVGGQADSRVNVINTNTLGHDSQTPVWLVTKYGSSRAATLRDAALPIATWREAHLIIAEVEGGQEAVNRINLLRGHHGLPTYAGGTTAEIAQQVRTERARELFLEGHHLNDLRRFDLPQIPAAGSDYRQGGIYGTARCFPLPEVERNSNPNVS